MAPNVHSLHEAVFWLLLAALWWLFYWPYRSYRLDETRHRLFVLRDRFFDAAADGESIRFEDRAYGMTRTTINGMLRTLGDYGFFRLLFVVWRYSRDERLQMMCARYEGDFEKAVNQLSPEGQRFVLDVTAQAERIFLGYVFSTSLPVFSFYYFSRFVHPVWRLSEHIWGRCKARVKPALDFESNIAGHDRRSASFLADANSAR